MPPHAANSASYLPPFLFLHLLLHGLLRLAVLSAGLSVTETGIPQCTSVDCGDGVHIRYPLWYAGASNGSSCGHPKLGVVCEGEHPVLKVGNDRYRVVNISYEAVAITLRDVDLLGSESSDCPRPRHNLTLEDGGPFAPAGIDAALFFFFNCSRSIRGGYELACLGGSGGRDSSYVLYADASDATPQASEWRGVCDEFVVAPVLKPSAPESSLLGNLSTSFGVLLNRGFSLRLQRPTTAGCTGCERSGGKCGYRSNGDLQCLCVTGNCNGGSRSTIKRKIVLGMAIGTSSLLLSSIIIYCLTYKKHFNLSSFLGWKSRSHNVEEVLEQYGSIVLKRYKFADIKKMTKSFNEKLGQGGYGTVYKGKLQDGKLVAVKLLNKSNENGEEFINEVAIIGQTRHVNIVCLLGFCCEGSKRALIYEFMPNGSLEKFIFSRKPGDMTLIGCEKLLEISIGIARGLEYLHRGCNARIVHFDIKPHNILLDEDFCPKISDFGLAMSFRPKQSILSMVGARGTIGYIAPEVFSRRFGVISSKSDVYSYGMMVLEMAGGRKNVDVETSNTSEVYFPHWIYDHFHEGGGVKKFFGATTETEEVFKKMVLVGLWCIQTKPSSRPSMSKVVEMLEGNFTDLQVPPKPYMLSP